MSRICPECGKPPAENGLVKCHKCQVPFIEESEFGLKLSNSQLEQISRSITNSWRFWIKFSVVFLIALLLVGVPTVTVIGVHLATKQLNKSLDQFNGHASNELAAAYQDVTNRISIALQDYERRADAQLSSAHQDMTNRIAQEFEEPKIRAIVGQVAANQASNLLSQQINPQIAKFREGTSNTLAQFHNSLQTFQEESTNALTEVRSATEFSLIVAEAQNDDYFAFNQLIQIANSPKSPFAKSATAIASTIIDDVDADTQTMPSLVGIKWEMYSIDPSKVSFQRLKDLYSSNPNGMLMRFNVVRQIFNDNRFPEIERYDFLATVLQTDNSLRIRELCCDLIDTKAKTHLNFTKADFYLQWLAQNRATLTNAPSPAAAK